MAGDAAEEESLSVGLKSPDHMDQGIDFPSSRLAHAAVIPTKVGIQQVGEEPWIPAFARMTKKSWG